MMEDFTNKLKSQMENQANDIPNQDDDEPDEDE